MLGNFDKKIQSLKNVYHYIFEELKKSPDLLMDGELKSIQDRYKELCNDQRRFTLAVAGQLKAGKSTFLNALIFGNEILPSDDIEMTAKLTRITKSDKSNDYFKVFFYNEEEWDELESKNTQADQASKEWDESYDLLSKVLRSEGASISKKISERVIEVDDLSSLVDYVGKKGKYTLLIKEVVIYSNSDVLKYIDIVDTPGMNSPDPIRDRIVKDWIIKADAVIYCTYAGKAFDHTDVKFIKDYLTHISMDKRVFALTKADALSGDNAVNEEIERLIASSLNNEYLIIESKKQVFPICQLAMLIENMYRSGVELSDDLSEHAERIENGYTFKKAISQFEHLVNYTSERIFDNNNIQYDIINTECERLDRYLMDSIKTYQMEEGVKSDTLNELKNNNSIELNKKIFQEKSKELKKVEEIIIDTINTQITGNMKDFIDQNLTKKAKHAIKELHDKYQRCSNFKGVKEITILNRIDSEISDIQEACKLELKYHIKTGTESLLQQVNFFQTEQDFNLPSYWDAGLKNGGLYYILSNAIEETMDESIKMLKNKFQVYLTDSTENAGIWKSIKTWSYENTRLTEMKNKIFTEFQKIEEDTKNNFDSIHRTFRQSVKNKFDSVFSTLDMIVNEQSKELKVLQEQEQSKDIMIKNLESSIQILNQKLDILNLLKENIQYQTQPLRR